jgi:hypothetical protein
LPGIGGIESIPFELPLCDTHRREYESRRRRYQTSLTLTALPGVCLLFGIPMLLDKPGPPGLLAIVAILVGLALVLASIGIFFTRSRCFPVEFRAHQGKLFTGHSEYTFTFPDETAAKAFAQANGTEVES